MSESLFHYTDVGAVKSILESRQLWLTDIRFLNDSQELNDGVAFIVEALCEEFQDENGDGEFLDSAIQYLSAEFDNHISFGIDEEPVFVCSFSEAGNQLSQWRAYGNYAIEFDRSVIHDEMDLFVCTYEETSKRYIAREMVFEEVYAVAKELRLNDGMLSNGAIDALSALVRTASTFKDQSFYEEKEVRVAIDLSLPNNALYFRSRGNILVPYTTVGFSVNAIKAIHIGPMRDQDLAYTSIKSYVSSILSKFYSDGGDIEHEIEIIKSAIPYRPA